MRKILIIIINVFCALSIKSQDPHFTQILSNPIYLNPAFSGNALCPRLSLNARVQWPNLSGTYKTATASYDQFIEPLGGGIGVQFTYDNAADVLITQNVNISYAYRLKISDSCFIIPAIRVGTGLRNYHNPALLITQHSNIYFNSGAGIILEYKNLNFGFAADHLNNPNVGFDSDSPLPVLCSLHAIYNLNISDDVKITPLIYYAHQNVFNEILFSAIAQYKIIRIGGGLRTGFENPDAALIFAGIDYAKFTLGYSYDYTISKLASYTGGSHELSLIYTFN